MSVYDRVLASPHSKQARLDLAAYWARMEDPRAELITCQFESKYIQWQRSARAFRRALALIQQHGREWAGPIESLVATYEYEYGMISAISIQADRFVALAQQLVELAPLVDVALLGPVDVREICKLPQLAQISTLRFAPGPWLTDEAVAALVASPFAKGMRVVASPFYDSKLLLAALAPCV